MKLFGSLSEIVSLIFRKNSQAITLRPNQATTYTASRDIQTPPQDANSVLVSESATQVITGKTIDGDDNTVQDLPITSLKTVVGDANKVFRRDGSGVPQSGNSIPNASPLITTDSTQTITNKTIDGDNNTVQDLPDTSLKTNITNASKFFTRDASGIPESATKAVPAGAVVGTTDTQSITNKTLDNTNTVTLKDTLLSIQDDGDATKIAKFDVASIATGTTRTLAFPDVSSSLLARTSSDLAANRVKNKDLEDSTTTIVDATDTTKFIRFDAGGTTGTGTTVRGIQTGNRLISLPDSDVLLAGVDNTQTFSNKTLDNTNTITVKDANFTIQDDGDTTKQAKFQASGITTGTTRTLTIPNASTTLVGQDTTDTMTNKSLVDSSVSFVDDGDNTKKMQFQVSGVTTGTTRTLTVPNASTTIVGTDTTDTLTNKTLTSPAINTPNLDGGTASATSRVVVSKETTTNLNALTRKQAAIYYDTTTNEFKGDTGSTLNVFAAAVNFVPGTTTGSVPSTGLPGFTDASNATAGTVGEYKESIYSNVTVTNATTTDGTSLSLTAGDWAICHVAAWSRNGATTSGAEIAAITGISVTSGGSPADQVDGNNSARFQVSTLGTTTPDSWSLVSQWRRTISTTTTYYAKIYGETFSAGNHKFSGKLFAIRIR